MRIRFPRLRASAQPVARDELNERDVAAGKTVRVPSRVSRGVAGTDEVEAVWCEPDAAEHWEARRWRSP